MECLVYIELHKILIVTLQSTIIASLRNSKNIAYVIYSATFSQVSLKSKMVITFKKLNQWVTLENKYQ